jgi:DNA-binding PadR family transcriptional regulator
MLILKSLLSGELHGLAVSRRIKQLTGGTFSVKPGSLFPALHRRFALFGGIRKTTAAQNIIV